MIKELINDVSKCKEGGRENDLKKKRKMLKTLYMNHHESDGDIGEFFEYVKNITKGKNQNFLLDQCWTWELEQHEGNQLQVFKCLKERIYDPKLNVWIQENIHESGWIRKLNQTKEAKCTPSPNILIVKECLMFIKDNVFFFFNTFKNVILGFILKHISDDIMVRIVKCRGASTFHFFVVLVDKRNQILFQNNEFEVIGDFSLKVSWIYIFATVAVANVLIPMVLYKDLKNYCEDFSKKSKIATGIAMIFSQLFISFELLVTNISILQHEKKKRVSNNSVPRQRLYQESYDLGERNKKIMKILWKRNTLMALLVDYPRIVILTSLMLLSFKHEMIRTWIMKTLENWIEYEFVLVAVFFLMTIASLAFYVMNIR